MTRPEGETRKERRLQRVVGTGVVVLFLLLGIIVVQGVVGYRSQINHHASTEAQQTEILTLLHTVRDAQVTNKGTITDIKTLETQVASVIEGLPAADKQITTFAQQLLEVEQWAIGCLSHNVGCQSPPTLTTTGS